VPSSDTNVIEIVESCAELGANQRVGWWIKLACHAVGLEAENTSGNEIHIISPPGNDWVSVDSSAWNSSGGEALLKTFPSLSKSNFLSLLAEPVSNEGILSIAVGITASGFLL
jgi:hypothetical protein